MLISAYSMLTIVKKPRLTCAIVVHSSSLVLAVTTTYNSPSTLVACAALGRAAGTLGLAADWKMADIGNEAKKGTVTIRRNCRRRCIDTYKLPLLCDSVDVKTLGESVPAWQLKTANSARPAGSVGSDADITAEAAAAALDLSDKNDLLIDLRAFYAAR